MRNIQVKSRNNFRFSVIVNYFLLVIIPFVALIAIFVFFFSWYARDNYGNSTLRLMESEQQRLNSLSRGFVDDSMFLYYGDLLESFDDGRISAAELNTSLEDAMDRELAGRSGINEMLIVYGNQSAVSGKHYEDVVPRLAEFDEELRETGGRSVWLTTLPVRPKDGSGYKMVLGRSLNSSKQKDVGKLYLLIDINSMNNIIDSFSGEKGSTFLVNNNGMVLNASDPSGIGSQMHLLDYGITGGKGYQDCRLGKANGLAVHVTSYRTNLTLVHFAANRDILKGINLFIAVAVLVGGIYLLSLWMMLRRLNKRILVPIGKLAGKMDDFAAGDMTAEADPNEEGEIGRLNQHFNDMTGRIHDLLLQNSREQQEKNDFKMKALISQLSPHFLYNALNTIKWMAVINRQDNIRNMTEALIRILMAAAQSGEDYYLVSDEIKLIESYAVILKARYMNFTIDYDIQPEAENCRIRRFLIQPVVENSIVHGFSKGGMKNGKVWIQIRVDSSLHIVVRDNGCGFDVSRLDERGRDSQTSHVSLAISNIRQIIDIEYGMPYQMTIQSQPGKGTTVEYILPVLKDETSAAIHQKVNNEEQEDEL